MFTNMSATAQLGPSLEIILFRTDGWMAGWRMAYSDNNATQPAGAGAWLSLAITLATSHPSYSDYTIAGYTPVPISCYTGVQV